MVTLRDARNADVDALVRIDADTWSPEVTPAPEGRADASRWRARIAADHAIVAEVDGVVVGSVVLGQAIPLATHAHVLEIRGLAVAPEHQGRGIARALVAAACERAERCGARKLSLRVMATNPSARRLYESCGFRVEGVLRGEFLIGGVLVDDVLMARELSPATAAENPVDN